MWAWQTSTTQMLSHKHQRRWKSSFRQSLLMNCGTNMASFMISMCISCILRLNLTKLPAAIYGWLPSCKYPWAAYSWPPPSSYKGYFQGPSHYLGPGVSWEVPWVIPVEVHPWWNRSAVGCCGPYQGLLFHSILIFSSTGSRLHHLSLASAALNKGGTSNSGLAMTQRHWWRYPAMVAYMSIVLI